MHQGRKRILYSIPPIQRQLLYVLEKHLETHVLIIFRHTYITIQNHALPYLFKVRGVQIIHTLSSPPRGGPAC